MPPKRPAREKKNKLKLQFQVHPAGENDEPGALRTRSGRSYGKTSRSPVTTGKGGSRGVSKNNVSLPSSPFLLSTTEGMDSEEGQQLSHRLVKKLQDLGSGRGRASVDTCKRWHPMLPLQMIVTKVLLLTNHSLLVEEQLVTMRGKESENQS